MRLGIARGVGHGSLVDGNYASSAASAIVSMQVHALINPWSSSQGKFFRCLVPLNALSSHHGLGTTALCECAQSGVQNTPEAVPHGFAHGMHHATIRLHQLIPR